ncbi:MAG: dockerin type I domain-containing protein [Planctomycetota bacterium]
MKSSPNNTLACLAAMIGIALPAFTVSATLAPDPSLWSGTPVPVVEYDLNTGIMSVNTLGLNQTDDTMGTGNVGGDDVGMVSLLIEGPPATTPLLTDIVDPPFFQSFVHMHFNGKQQLIKTLGLTDVVAPGIVPVYQYPTGLTAADFGVVEMGTGGSGMPTLFGSVQIVGQVACCLPGGCMELTPADCAALGGTAAGVEFCADVLCNDDCDTPFAITDGETFMFDSTNATPDGLEGCLDDTVPDQWLCYTATSDLTTISISPSPGQFVAYSIVPGCGPATGSDIGCILGFGDTTTIYETVPGQQYKIRLTGEGTIGFDRAGACCLPTSCSTIDSDLCTDLGGVYQGDGIPCITTGTGCPFPGACCLTDGMCIQAEEFGDANGFCSSMGGFYQSDNVMCSDVMCAQPGVCCLPDGSCISAQELGDVVDFCVSMGGEYQGDDSMCMDVMCPQPGGCCLPDGSCIPAMMNDDEDQFCVTQGGRYEGNDTLCGDFMCDPAGACCDLQFGTCRLMFEDECIGPFAEFQGDDVPCDPNPCPPAGACCMGDMCNEFTEQFCLNNGGCYFGDDSTCEPTTLLPAGVICLDCNMNGVEDSCESTPMFDPAEAFPSDTCANAEVLSSEGFVYGGDTTAATSDAFIFCNAFFSSFDQYYAYTPRSEGNAFVSVTDAGPEVYMISIHTDCPATEGNMIACSFTQQQGVGFDVDKGVEYIIRVAALGNDRGMFMLELSGPPALTNPIDDNANSVPDECECRADVNGDGVVDAQDFIQAMNEQGNCVLSPPGCPSDVNQDGTVDTADLALIINAYGDCPFAVPAMAPAVQPRAIKGSPAGVELMETGKSRR